MSALTAASIEPDFFLQAATYAEPKLKTEFLRLESAELWPPADGSIDRSEFINRSASFLELLLVGAFLQEELTRLGCSSPDDLTLDVIEAVDKRTIAMYGLDLRTVSASANDLFDDQLDCDVDHTFTLSLPAIVSFLKSVLDVCPIGQLEGLAIEYDLPSQGHRCRIAYDGIQALVIRNGSKQQAQLSVIGRAYVDGSLSISDAATLLELHPVDVVPLLEDHGYKRGLAEIALGDEERQAAFQVMREDRLSRDGEPEWTAETIARDVVSSERIESVDARRWIPREGR